MSTNNLTRKHQKVFGESTAQLGVFGSAQDGTKQTSSDVETLQSLSAYLQGWSFATLGGKRVPTLEEFNAVNYINTYQLAYLFQKGLPEYNIDTTYFTGDYCRNGSQLYESKIDDNLGNAVTDVTIFKPTIDLSLPNFLTKNSINGFLCSYDRTFLMSNLLVVNEGLCTTQDNSDIIKLDATISKLLDSGSSTHAPFVEGDGNGGWVGPFPTTNAESCYIYAIAKDDDTTDICISTLDKTLIGASLPSGFTKFRRVGAVKTTLTDFFPPDFDMIEAMEDKAVHVRMKNASSGRVAEKYFNGTLPSLADMEIGTPLNIPAYAELGIEITVTSVTNGFSFFMSDKQVAFATFGASLVKKATANVSGQSQAFQMWHRTAIGTNQGNLLSGGTNNLEVYLIGFIDYRNEGA